MPNSSSRDEDSTGRWKEVEGDGEQSVVILGHLAKGLDFIPEKMEISLSRE